MTEQTSIPDQIRSPITVILGHVDSGKTSLLDKVRGTAVQARETAGITQHIGASFFPVETIEAICGKLLAAGKKKLKIPGILIVDTPGHASFMNLRERGASVANFAILVVDARRGIQPQTIESLRILRQRKVPFLVALNKIDRIKGWQQTDSTLFSVSVKQQRQDALNELDNAIYSIMTELGRFDLDCDRFDKISDYTKKVAIVPTSAVTGEGIPELFLVLSGITQQYLLQKITLSLGKGKGTILEVKEEPGLGKTIDVILFDGIIKKGSKIVVSGLDGAFSTYVKALLEPKALDEIRDPRDRFNSVEEIVAAAGVKISAPNLEEAVAGASIRVVENEKEEKATIEELDREMGKVAFETDTAGVILKADTLGSLEALVALLHEYGIQIRTANVGPITRRDVVEANLTKGEDEKLGIILAFRVPVLPDAEEESTKCGIPIFESDIIYGIADTYRDWLEERKREDQKKLLDGLTLPATIQVLPYIFRQSNPAVVGVEVKAGVLVPRTYLVNRDNKRIGMILQIQDKSETVAKAKVGDQVAISIKGAIAGRHIKEDDDLFVSVPESDARRMLEPEVRTLLSGSDLDALDQIIEIKRRCDHKFWAI